MRRALLFCWCAAALACGRAIPDPPAEAPTADAATARPAVDAAAAAGRARYLALGDSFTAGTGSATRDAFPARLAARWRDARCEVATENLAVNGYTTTDVLAVELPQVLGPVPDLVTLAIGANDIVRGAQTSDYEQNVRQIFSALEAKGIGGARVVTLPQPDWSKSPEAASFGDPAALLARIRELNASLRAISLERGARYVDLFPRMEAQAQAGMLAPDGLHPSKEAYDAWAEDLFRALPSPCPP